MSGSQPTDGLYLELCCCTVNSVMTYREASFSQTKQRGQDTDIRFYVTQYMYCPTSFTTVFSGQALQMRRGLRQADRWMKFIINSDITARNISTTPPPPLLDPTLFSARLQAPKIV
ncbi:hypothetical protein BaRGS_00010867 [Batillaria attramentaria]|uniref:Uncharacterized protein n=1 Tax=Batillaria attramentaria TaxID=370345 RepID=A0ABD0LEU8_9CAEN